MSGHPLFLGIDIGTTTVKASLVDLAGGAIADASLGYPTRFVRPSWVEQKPEDWWRTTIEVLRLLGYQAGAGAMAAIAGIGVSSQAPALVPLDEKGRSIGPALIWMDRRAAVEAGRLKERMPAADYAAITGNRMDPFFVAPKLAWLRANDPGAFARAATFIQVNGYLVHRLTGVLSMDEQHASLLGLRDLRTSEWSGELLEAVGVDPSRFPAVSPASTVVGEITREASAATGLPAGVPVVAGTVDSAAAALEAGVIEPGEAAEMTGTSTVVVMPVDRMVAQTEFIAMASIMPSQWLYLAAMVSTGASLKWLKDLAGQRTDFETMTAEAGEVGPGADGLLFLPYMMGERSPLWSTDARGTFVGLTLGSGVAELTRAVLEGTAFALRHNLDVAETHGLRPSSLRATGGPAASDVWCQIKADVTGLPILRVNAPTGATFGDAVLAAVGTGHIADLGAAVVAAAQIDRAFEPNPAHRRRYDELFAVYRSTHDHLRGEFRELARITDHEGPA